MKRTPLSVPALARAPPAGIAKMNRWPSWLTFFHCIGFPGSGPGSENSIRGCLL